MDSGDGKNVLYLANRVDTRNATQLRAIIAQIDTIIDTLLTSALTSVQNSNVAEYELDTGQTRTKVRYTSVATVNASVTEYENLRQLYVNKLERLTLGNATVLVDERNLRRRR